MVASSVVEPAGGVLALPEGSTTALGSAPHAVAPHEVAAVHAAGVGLVPHHTQLTPLAGLQLTNVTAFRCVEQAVVEQDRLMCVNPVSAAAVLQLGKVFVLRVLLLTMLT